MNLCTNAYQAMELSGGILDISLKASIREDGEASGLAGIMTGSHVVLTISDTGCGMDEETRKHIFDPFFTTKEKGKGTGLGLATVHRIVTGLQGEIIINTTVNKGTTFTIFLPCHRTGE
jgi:signal transduction histidine kinase